MFGKKGKNKTSFLDKIKRWHTGEVYDYDFNRKLGVDNSQEEMEYWNKTEEWNETEGTEGFDYWKGYSYYQKPLLDYQYVEKMANALASQYKIEIKIGSYWAIDLKNKILTYDPLTLLSGTKANVICCLLHEIGHLAHSETADDLRSKGKSSYLSKYEGGAYEILNLFEDFRIDEIMSKAYEGAEDVFDSNKPKVEEMALKYSNKGEEFSDSIMRFVNSVFDDCSTNSSIGNKKKLKNLFGTTNKKIIEKKIALLQQKINDRDTLFDYVAQMIFCNYDIKGTNPKGKMAERIDKTKKDIPAVKELSSTFKVLNLLDKDVYPVIEDLFGDVLEKQKDVSSLFSNELARQATNFARNGMSFDYGGGEDDIKNLFNRLAKPHQVRSGRGEVAMPEKWENGDYDALKQSVTSAINELIRKLTFLRRKELTLRWVDKMKRGRINPVGLYKYKLGSTRLFKRKEEVVDTLKSYAFSLIVDSSGSMQGSPIIHSTRGAIILAEVFNKLNIPFEAMMFDSDARILKGFDDSYKKNQQVQIAGLTQRSGGCTNLDMAFETTKILGRLEKNRFIILLSDGDIGGRSYVEKYFKNFDKGNVKVIGFGINCGDNVVELCNGVGKAIDSPASLPGVFSDLLKSILLKKKMPSSNY